MFSYEEYAIHVYFEEIRELSEKQCLGRSGWSLGLAGRQRKAFSLVSAFRRCEQGCEIRIV